VLSAPGAREAVRRTDCKSVYRVERVRHIDRSKLLPHSPVTVAGSAGQEPVVVELVVLVAVGGY